MPRTPKNLPFLSSLVVNSLIEGLRRNPTVGYCQIIKSDLVRFGQTLLDSVRFGRLGSDLLGLGQIWLGSVGFDHEGVVESRKFSLIGSS